METFEKTQRLVVRRRLTWPLRSLVIVGITSSVLVIANLHHADQVAQDEFMLDAKYDRDSHELATGLVNLPSLSAHSVPQSLSAIEPIPLQRETESVPSPVVVKQVAPIPVNRPSTSATGQSNTKPVVPLVVNIAPPAVENQHPAAVVAAVPPVKLVKQQPPSVPSPAVVATPVVPKPIPNPGQNRLTWQAIQINADGAVRVSGSGDVAEQKQLEQVLRQLFREMQEN